MQYLTVLLMLIVYILYTHSKYKGIISFNLSHCYLYHKNVDVIINHLIGKCIANTETVELKNNKLYFGSGTVVTVDDNKPYLYGVLTSHHNSTEYQFCNKRCSTKMFLELKKFKEEINNKKIVDIIYPK